MRETADLIIQKLVHVELEDVNRLHPKVLKYFLMIVYFDNFVSLDKMHSFHHQINKKNIVHNTIKDGHTKEGLDAH